MRGFKRFGERGLLVPDTFGSERRARLQRNTQLKLLSELPVTPQSVFSLKLRLKKAKYCLNVRRSSDNATKDFGFFDGELDWWKLGTWAGSDSVFVNTWYDQALNQDLTQSTSNRQPRIVNAGDREYAGVFFNGTNNQHCMGISSYTMGTPLIHFFIKGTMMLSGTRVVLETTAVASTAANAFVFYELSTTGFILDCYNAAGGGGRNRVATYAASAYTPPYRSTFSGLMDRTQAMASDVLMRVNSSTSSVSLSGSTDQTNNFDTSSLNLMARDALGGTASLNMQGTVEDLVVYQGTTNDTTSYYSEIERILREV